MLSWVMCWLHGHVVCDGSVMVGKMGGGWFGEWAGEWTGWGDPAYHTSMTIVPALTQHNAFQSRGGWGQCCPIG